MSLASQLQSILAPDLERRGNLIRTSWDRVSGLPGGTRLFSRFIGRVVPYTGSIGAHVVELREGYAKVVLADRRAVRNHLNCVHAIALCNLAELCGNVAVAYALPDDARFIVSGLSIEYAKKARGTIVAESRPPRIAAGSTERVEVAVEVGMRDGEGVLVARAPLRSLLGPKKDTGA